MPRIFLPDSSIMFIKNYATLSHHEHGIHWIVLRISSFFCKVRSFGGIIPVLSLQTAMGQMDVERVIGIEGKILYILVKIVDASPNASE